MFDPKRRTIGFLKCRHCGNFAPTDIVADYYLSTKPELYYPEDEDYYDSPQPEQGYIYKLLLCLACKEVTLWKCFEHDLLDSDNIEIETLYPPQGLKSSILPSAIQKAYEAALKARTIDANAYAILLGRMLEVVVRIAR